MHAWDDTYKRNRTISLSIGRGLTMKCFEEVLPFMSLGEKVFIICPWELAFGEGGAYPFVKPKTNAPFELETVEMGRDPDYDYSTNKDDL